MRARKIMISLFIACFGIGLLEAGEVKLSAIQPSQEHKEIIGNFFDGLLEGKTIGIDEDVSSQDKEIADSIKEIFQDNYTTLFGQLTESQLKNLFQGTTIDNDVHRYFEAMCCGILYENKHYINYADYFFGDSWYNLRSYVTSGRICQIFYTYFSGMLEKTEAVIETEETRKKIETLRLGEHQLTLVSKFKRIVTNVSSVLQNTSKCWRNALLKYQDNEGLSLNYMLESALLTYVFLEFRRLTQGKNVWFFLSTPEYYLESTVRLYVAWIEKKYQKERRKIDIILFKAQITTNVQVQLSQWKKTFLQSREKHVHDTDKKTIITNINRIIDNAILGRLRRFGRALLSPKGIMSLVTVTGMGYLLFRNRETVAKKLQKWWRNMLPKTLTEQQKKVEEAAKGMWQRLGQTD